MLSLYYNRKIITHQVSLNEEIEQIQKYAIKRPEVRYKTSKAYRLKKTLRISTSLQTAPQGPLHPAR